MGEIEKVGVSGSKRDGELEGGGGVNVQEVVRDIEEEGRSERGSVAGVGGRECSDICDR